MAVDAGTIYSEVRIQLDKLTGDIKNIDAKFDQFAARNKTQSDQVSKSWTSSFKNINLAGVAAFAAIGIAVKQSIDLFAKFQQSMANVQSVTDASAADFQRLEEAAIQAGESTRFTATQAADAMYYLASAGLDATQVIGALNGVLELAGATGSDLASTSAIMAATLSQFNIEAEDSARVSNVFAAAISNSQANMEKLGNAMKQVGPISGALGISLEETTANLEALFNAGFAGEQAGTALRNILLDLNDSTGPVVKQLEALGVSFDKVNPKEVGLTNAIDELAKSGIDLGNVFGKRVAAQILTLAKTGGDALRELEADITDTNKAAELYAIQNDTLAGSIDFLKSAVESAQIKLVEELEPALRGIIDFITQAVYAFNSLPGPVKLAVGVFAAGIPVVTGLAAAIGLLSSALGAAGGPITLVVAGISILAGVVSFLATSAERSRDAFKEQAKAIGDNRRETGEMVKRFEELKTKTNLSNLEQIEFERIQRELKKRIPEVSEQIDNQTLSVQELTKEYSKWDDAQKALEIKQHERNIIELNKRLIELDKTIIAETANRDELQKAYDDAEGSYYRQLNFQKKLEASEDSLINKYKERNGINLEIEELQNQILALKGEVIDETETETEVVEDNTDAIDDNTDSTNENNLARERLNKNLRGTVNETREVRASLGKLSETEEELADKNQGLIDLEEQYRQKLEDLGKSALELIEIERQRQIESIQASEADQEYKDQAIQAVNEYYDTLKDNTANQIFKDQLQSVTDFTLNAFSEMFGAIGELQAANTQQRLNELDRQLQAQLEAAGLAEETEIEKLQRQLEEAKAAGDEETVAQTEQDIKRLEIEKDFERQKAQIQYEGELAAWKFKVTDAIINTATAAINAYQSAAAIPVIGYILGPIAAAAATAFGLVRVAAVRKAKPEPPAFQTGGIVTGPTGTDNVEAKLTAGEMVLTKEQQARLFNIANNSTGRNETITIIVPVNLDGKEITKVVANYFNNGIVRLK